MTAANMLPEALAALREHSRWVVWSYELDARGRRTKVPYAAHGRKASSTNARTWAAFDALPLGNGFAGPGVMLGDGLQGVDLDACIDADGALEPWAAAVVEKVDTYTEVSPSGRGLKMLFYGPPGASAEVKFGDPVELAPGEFKTRELALFTAGRYFTVTGRAWLDRPLVTIDEATAVWLRERIAELRTEEQDRKRATAEPKRARQRRAAAAATPAAAAEAPTVRLPDALMTLIRDGVPEGERSEKFFHAVRWAAECGLQARQIVELLLQHPRGIAEKYQGRVAVEVDRALVGHDAKLLLPPSHSDDDLALEFVGSFGPTFRWSHGLGWMFDAGTAWRADHELRRFDAARRVCRRAAAANGGSPKVAKALASAKTVAATLALAQSDPRLVVPPACWDADPMLLNTPGGIVDLRTGELRARRPDDYVTHAARVAPDFERRAEVFEQFLQDVFGGDAQMVDFMQRALGYCATGDRREQVLFFWHGSGANGKSTLLDLVQWIFDAYALKLPAAALMVSRGERHPTELAQLRGKRLAISSELEEGQFWNEALIKELTGDEVLTARFMRQDFFDFTMTQKHVIVGNHKPRLRGGDPAIARRLVLVPFEVKFEGARRDKAMPDKLKAEAPAILAWIIRGAVRWHHEGLQMPQRARAATVEYLADHDDLALWMDECCLRSGESRAGELYASFSNWKKNRGEHAPSATAWTPRLLALPGVTKRKSMGAMRYTGIMLNAVEEARVRQAW